MKLSIKDRIVFEAFLPKQGNIVDIKVAKDLREKVEIQQEEMIKVNLRVEGAFTKWDAGKDFDIEIEITDLEKSLLKKQVEELDKLKSINDQNLDLALKIQEM